MTADMASAASPSTQAIAKLSAAARIEHLRTQVWVSYPEAKEVLVIMARLFDAPNETRPECLALIGEPSFGKTYLIEQFVAAKIPNDEMEEGEEPAVPLIRIEMPESPEPAAMLREIIASVNAPFSPRLPVDELMRKIMVLVDSLRIRLSIIDEFHKGFQGTLRQQMIMLNVARGLTNRTKRPLIVAGTEKVDDFLRNDTQLDERFVRRRLRRWKEDSDLQRLLKGFEQQLGLGQPSKLASPALTSLIHQLTGGRMGRISRLLTLAAEAAILSGEECISEVLLRNAAKQLPGESLAAV